MKKLKDVPKVEGNMRFEDKVYLKEYAKLYTYIATWDLNKKRRQK